MTNSEFIDYCTSELTKSFNNTKKGIINDKHRHRVEGLLQAATLLGIIKKSELETIMAEKHLVVFGETIESRNKRKNALQTLKTENPDQYYEIPTFDRKS